jgi:hypothetical protein
MVIATPVLVMIVGFGPVRQGLAISMLMVAAVCYATGRRRTAAALLLTAPLFHWTAILLLPLIPLMWGRRLIAVSRFALAGLVLGAIVAALHIVVPGVAGAGDAKGAWLRQAPALLAIVAAIWLSRQPDRPREETTLLGFLVGIAVLGIVSGFGSTVTMDRIGYLALPLQLMAFPRAVAALAPRWRRPAWCAIAATYLILFAGWLTFSTHTACFIPYGSYLVDTQHLLREEAEPYWLSEGFGPYETPGTKHARR